MANNFLKKYQINDNIARTNICAAVAYIFNLLCSKRYILFQPAEYILQIDNLILYLLAFTYRLFCKFIYSWQVHASITFIYNTISHEPSFQLYFPKFEFLRACGQWFFLFDNRVSFSFEKKTHFISIIVCIEVYRYMYIKNGSCLIQKDPTNFGRSKDNTHACTP